MESSKLDKLIDERVLKYEELWMKEREVQALKEIEQRLKESEMQTQKSLVIEGATLKTSLVTEGGALEALVNSSTSLEQQHDYNSSRNEYNRLGNENESSDNERSSSGNDADVDIRPLNDSDTVFEVHHDMFKNMFIHEIQNHEQPKSIPNTYVTNENNSNIISDIPNMDPDRDKEEHNYVDDEQQRAFFVSLIKNLNCDVEKCTKVNHEAQQANVLLTNELERYKEKVKHLQKIRQLNLEIECLMNFDKSDEAKIKFDIEDLETLNVELEYSVASLLKDFLQKSLYDPDPSNVESKSGKKYSFRK
ncbi:hypothetical protein Tco_0122958 [Tanacetum coccineum]